VCKTMIGLKHVLLLDGYVSERIEAKAAGEQAFTPMRETELGAMPNPGDPVSPDAGK
jgi:hypothetical protein